MVKLFVRILVGVIYGFVLATLAGFLERAFHAVDLLGVGARYEVDPYVHGKHEHGTKATDAREREDIVEGEYALEHAGLGLSMVAAETSIWSKFLSE